MRIRLFILIFLLVFLASTSVVDAQTVNGSGWSEPVNLSNTAASSAVPTITSDQFGLVHVFWSEALGGRPHPFGIAPQSGNAIMYRCLKDGVWSDPVDLFYAGKNGSDDLPTALVDKNGMLQLVWLEGGHLRYSSAPAWDATRVTSWAAPSALSTEYVNRVQLVDLGDKLMAIYNPNDGEKAGVYSMVIDQGLFHAQVPVWEDKTGLAAQDISAAVDGTGRVHVVWSVYEPPDPFVIEILYSNSSDGGVTWSPPMVVARETSTEDSLAMAYPWVAVRGQQEIHIQWAQGRLTYRWHQYSTDGGQTWNPAYQIWPDLVSQTSSDAVSVDSDNNLYWIDVLRYPNGAYLMRWVDGKWQRPELFYLNQIDWKDPIGDRINVHRIRSTISLGNELHIVFVDESRAEIWYMHKTLQSSRFPPAAIPDQTPTPDLMVAPPTLEVMPVVTPTQTISGLQDQTRSGESPSNRFTLILALANIPVILLVSIFIVKRSLPK